MRMSNTCKSPICESSAGTCRIISSGTHRMISRHEKNLNLIENKFQDAKPGYRFFLSRRKQGWSCSLQISDQGQTEPASLGCCSCHPSWGRHRCCCGHRQVRWLVPLQRGRVAPWTDPQSHLQAGSVRPAWHCWQHPEPPGAGRSLGSLCCTSIAPPSRAPRLSPKALLRPRRELSMFLIGA